MSSSTAPTSSGASNPPATSSNKRRKISVHSSSSKEDPQPSSSPFDLLDDDALRAILVRTRATDHDALRSTCKRFLGVLNSPVFRQDRAVLGYAEVQPVRLLSPFEQYKQNEELYNEDREEDAESVSSNDTKFQNEYDSLGRFGENFDYTFNDYDFRVFVDGKRLNMRELGLHLLPRRFSCFYEMCDNLSGNLYELGSTCFTDRGKFRLPSLKEAVPSKDRRPLLYISSFELPMELRSSGSAVGPKILQSLLRDALKNEWSIAMYIPHDSAQWTEQDKSRSYDMCDMLHCMRQKPLTDQEVQIKKDWEKRLDQLRDQDIRQFFRAGFKQITDSAVLQEGADTPYVVYATPSNNDSPTIFSEQEALDMNIARPPQALPTPKQTEQEKALSDMVRSKTYYRQHLVKERDNYRKPVRHNPQFMPIFHQMDSMLNESQRVVRRVEQHKIDLEQAQTTARAALESGPQAGLVEALQNLQDILQQVAGGEELQRLPINESASRAMLATLLESVVGPCIQDQTNEILRSQNSISKIQGKLAEVEQQMQEQCPELIAKKEDELHTYDQNFQKELNELLDTTSTASSSVDDVAATADVVSLIIKSNAIHACAYSSVGQTYINFLLDKLPTADQKLKAINSLDLEGSTPLMKAASSCGGSCLHRVFEMCTFLIGKGANKDILHQSTGRTALGAFRQNRRSQRNHDLVFGADLSHPILRARAEADDEAAKQLETLLLPSGGPSPADEAADVKNDEDDDDESTFFEDEEGEEEDEDEVEGEDEDEDEEED